MTWIKGEKQLLNLHSNFFLPLAFHCLSIPPLIRCLSLLPSIFYLQGTSHQSFPCPSIFSAHLFLFWPQFSLIQGFIFLCLSTARSPLSCRSPSLSGRSTTILAANACQAHQEKAAPPSPCFFVPTLPQLARYKVSHFPSIFFPCLFDIFLIL